ncbi:MAG: peroxiredoxin [Cyclobacteriaceae bacterium]|nr:peroxiredoxin [Cyclobacteriaceae bacterium]
MKIRLTILAGFYLFVCTAFQLYAQTPEKGDPAPDFKATTDMGNEWRLKDHMGKNYVVMFFYPAAMTGGCTRQACGFRDNAQVLKDLGAVVVGISGDKIENLPLFKEAHELNFDLLSDASGTIARSYGVPIRDGGSIVRNIDGKDFTLLRDVTTARWTFIIDKDGKIMYKNADVNVDQDPENVINAIKDHLASR